MARFPASLVLVGAGKMGGAMLEGWLAGGLDPRHISVIDPQPADSLKALAARHGFALNPEGAISAAQVVVLAIKPQMLDEAAPHVQPMIGPETLVVSVLAGKTVADLAARLPHNKTAPAIVRAMPNLPASVGRGVTGCYAAHGVSDSQRDMTTTLLSCVGGVEWVGDESLIDAVTSVSGSGPAYVFLLVECLAKAGEAQGLPADVAARLARMTITGAGELLHRSDLSPATLRQNVTSPGGTTAAALEVLMAGDGLSPLMVSAVDAARKRAVALSG